MAKKKQIQNIYETEQANKKHHKKNKKLEKREKLKKDKKKNKKIKHEKRKLNKYIQMSFKQNQKELDLARLPLDLDEVTKQVDKLIKLNESSVKEVPELFRLMEEEKKEINLSGLEDLNAQKYISKLFKNFKIFQNPKNPFKFKIREFQIDLNARYTTEVDFVIGQCISSYFLFVKSIFEFENFKIRSKEEDENNYTKDNYNYENNSNDDSKTSEDENSYTSESDNQVEKDEISENEKNNIYLKNKKKELDKVKYEIDYENKLIEEKFGGNAELVNKAFHKIMNDDQLFRDKSNKNYLNIFFYYSYLIQFNHFKRGYSLKNFLK